MPGIVKAFVLREFRVVPVKMNALYLLAHKFNLVAKVCLKILNVACHHLSKKLRNKNIAPFLGPYPPKIDHLPIFLDPSLRGRLHPDNKWE